MATLDQLKPNELCFIFGKIKHIIKLALKLQTFQKFLGWDEILEQG